MELCGNSTKTESSEKSYLLRMLVESTAEDPWTGELMTRERSKVSLFLGGFSVD